MYMVCTFNLILASPQQIKMAEEVVSQGGRWLRYQKWLTL